MTGADVFYFLMVVAASVFALIPCVLLMQVLMPRAVLDRYWKEPHFRPSELALFTGVFAPLRTFMLMWAIAFPRFGRKRNVIAADQLVPAWYRVLSAALTLWLLIAGSLIVTILAGFSIHDYLTQTL